MGGKLINLIKKHYSILGKITLTGYLCYWVYIIWQFDLNKTTYPLELFIILSIQISFTISVAIYIYFLWFKNESNDKFNRNIVIGLTVFTIFAFPMTYGILILGRTLSKFESVKIGSADGWLAFIGSIIGGLVTMVAVLITINNERKARKEDELKNELFQKNSLMPILDLDFPINPDNTIKKSSRSFAHIINLSNKSESHAIIKAVEAIEYIFTDVDTKENLFKYDRNYIIENEKKFSFISFIDDTVLAGKTDINLLFAFNFPNEINEYIINKSIKLLIKINLTYTDILEMQKYSQTYVRHIVISHDKEINDNLYLLRIDEMRSYNPPKKI